MDLYDYDYYTGIMMYLSIDKEHFQIENANPIYDKNATARYNETDKYILYEDEDGAHLVPTTYIESIPFDEYIKNPLKDIIKPYFSTVDVKLTNKAAALANIIQNVSFNAQNEMVVRKYKYFTIDESIEIINNQCKRIRTYLTLPSDNRSKMLDTLKINKNIDDLIDETYSQPKTFYEVTSLKEYEKLKDKIHDEDGLRFIIKEMLNYYNDQTYYYTLVGKIYPFINIDKLTGKQIFNLIKYIIKDNNYKLFKKVIQKVQESNLDKLNGKQIRELTEYILKKQDYNLFKNFIEKVGKIDKNIFEKNIRLVIDDYGTDNYGEDFTDLEFKDEYSDVDSATSERYLDAVRHLTNNDKYIMAFFNIKKQIIGSI